MEKEDFLYSLFSDFDLMLEVAFFICYLFEKSTEI